MGTLHVDHLLQVVQKKDIEGGMLLLMIGSKSPVRLCLIEYTNMLLEPLSSAPVQSLLNISGRKGLNVHMCVWLL